MILKLKERVNKIMFINISNTLSKDWEPNKTQEAQKWGKIIDIEFPYIDPMSSDDIFEETVDESKDKIKKLNPKKGDCVCIEGEIGITFDIIDYVHSCLNYVVCCYPVIDNDKNFIKFRFFYIM